MNGARASLLGGTNFVLGSLLGTFTCELWGGKRENHQLKSQNKGGSRITMTKANASVITSYTCNTIADICCVSARIAELDVVPINQDMRSSITPTMAIIIRTLRSCVETSPSRPMG